MQSDMHRDEPAEGICHKACDLDPIRPSAHALSPHRLKRSKETRGNMLQCCSKLLHLSLLLRVVAMPACGICALRLFALLDRVILAPSSQAVCAAHAVTAADILLFVGVWREARCKAQAMSAGKWSCVILRPVTVSLGAS